MELKPKAIKSKRGGARVGSGRKKMEQKNEKERKTVDLTLSIPMNLKEQMEARYPHKISKITTKFYDLLLNDDERVRFFNDFL